MFVCLQRESYTPVTPEQTPLLSLLRDINRDLPHTHTEYILYVCVCVYVSTLVLSFRTQTLSWVDLVFKRYVWDLVNCDGRTWSCFTYTFVLDWFVVQEVCLG
jgi:hypothetical protein